MFIACIIVFNDNPFTYFVEIPEKYHGLFYSNLLCGVIKGACEMIMIMVDCVFVEDTLNGDERTAIRIKLIKDLRENNSIDYE